MPIRLIYASDATYDVVVALGLTSALVAHEGYEIYSADTEGNRPIFLILPCLGVGYCLFSGSLNVNRSLFMAGLGLYTGIAYERYRATAEPKNATGALAVVGLALFLYYVYQHH